jgi:hypothetical protein
MRLDDEFIRYMLDMAPHSDLTRNATFMEKPFGAPGLLGSTPIPRCERVGERDVRR